MQEWKNYMAIYYILILAMESLPQWFLSYIHRAMLLRWQS